MLEFWITAFVSAALICSGVGLMIRNALRRARQNRAAPDTAPAQEPAPTTPPAPRRWTFGAARARTGKPDA